MIAQTWGSEQIVKVQGAVTFCPRLDEIHHCVVEDVLTGVVAPLTTVDAEPEEVAVRSHGEHLVADGLWLQSDDSDPGERPWKRIMVSSNAMLLPGS